MKFTKMNGLGNDYIFIDATTEQLRDTIKASKILSDRHRGIGSDGIVIIDASDIADCSMRIFNADGSEGETCGNALRCIGKYLYDKGKVDRKEIAVQTKAGIAKIKIKADKGIAYSVEVNMGKCSFVSGRAIQKIDTSLGCLSGYSVDIGNPHFVIFTEELTDELLFAGKEIAENKSFFTNGTNVEFVKIVNDKHIKMRVYERGTGETRACGSGAAASFFTAKEIGLVKDKILVELPGGTLLSYSNSDGEILIDGNAEFGFEGEIKEEYTLWQRLI